jgi:hypothetical protein
VTVLRVFGPGNHANRDLDSGRTGRGEECGNRRLGYFAISLVSLQSSSKVGRLCKPSAVIQSVMDGTGRARRPISPIRAWKESTSGEILLQIVM